MQKNKKTKFFESSFVTKILQASSRLRVYTAVTEEELEEVYRFRYEAYLKEDYISENADRIFKDKYDTNAVNVYLRDLRTREIVGTARLILESEWGFPTENLFNIEKPKEGREFLGEISRLAVDEKYRGKGSTAFLLLSNGLHGEARKKQLRSVYSNMPKKLTNHFIKLGFKFRELEQNLPEESHLKERDLIGGYFNKKELFPYMLDV